jgi:hypothetical protein
MKKLIKTRALLKIMIEKDRAIQMGKPLTDMSINESIKEMEDLEKSSNRYRNAFLFLAGLCFVRLLLNLL